MKLSKILLVLSIFLQFFENKEIDFIRKLEVEGTDNIETGELDTTEISDSIDFPPFNGTSDSAGGSYEFPSHSPTSDSAGGSYEFPSHAPDTVETETTIPFVIPDHPPATTTTPSDDNQSQTSDSGRTGSTSEFSNDLPYHPPSNATISEVPTLSTYPYTPNTAKPKIVLLGFGNFQKIESPRPTQQIIEIVVVITFRVYFKRYLYGTLHQFMRFHVDLTYSKFLRNLEEKEANCVKIRDVGEDIEYNCTVPDIEPNKTIETLASKNDYIFNDGTHDEPAGESGVYEFVQSSFANSTAGNIEKQLSDDLTNTIVINSAKLNVPDPNKPYFEIVGYSETPIKDKEVTFSFDEKGNGILKNVTCEVLPLVDNKYQFNCESEKSLRANINSAMGKSPNGINVLLNFDKDAEGKYNDLLVVNNLSNFYGKQYYSNAGLSGAAIAGIVIACVSALILIGLFAFCCKNKVNPHPINETVMQIYSSNSNADNI